ncbi:Nif11-like leader peptide family natural product precursor [Synechococcus sp. CBW1006]|uniref:Nif11-like leader peptide family natural product precursor n=1 Tax=Synechococcus sp. CBW1006 TaxID=1353138 RepID=UPI0018CFB1D2|nr:Nif11-like leader peptide family natural product precursor [Synechococcus sp. CBW1006]QPN68099.1 Nif11-like leader peptide family natural product precursor [Synechococcus sp. CBW1006]
MSWSELERLVAEAEADSTLRAALHRCRTRAELILTARRLGYRISRLDLQRAQAEHLLEEQVMAAAVGE